MKRLEAMWCDGIVSAECWTKILRFRVSVIGAGLKGGWRCVFQFLPLLGLKQILKTFSKPSFFRGIIGGASLCDSFITHLLFYVVILPLMCYHQRPNNIPWLLTSPFLHQWRKTTIFEFVTCWKGSPALVFHPCRTLNLKSWFMVFRNRVYVCLPQV